MVLISMNSKSLACVAHVLLLCLVIVAPVLTLQPVKRLPAHPHESKIPSVFQQWYRRIEDTQGVIETPRLEHIRNILRRKKGRRVSDAYSPPTSSTVSVDSYRGGEQVKIHKTGKGTRHKVTNAHELRRLVLDEKVSLSDLDIEIESTTHQTVQGLSNHEVLKVIAQRCRERSKPGQRAKGDNARVALSLEGGGMRGAVSAGMAAAISHLGLQDSFDVVYGSSAGSCIGAYMVSQQLLQNSDLYTKILTEAERQFVCRYRIIRGLVMNLLDFITLKVLSCLASPQPSPMSFVLQFSRIVAPGMNLTFVLDSVMHPRSGLRPLDLEGFIKNDKKQPLRIVSSYVSHSNGTKLSSRCFGTDDFLPSPNGEYSHWGGLDKYLKASMLVPGAAGPPVPITTSQGTHCYFDAFCFEPLPYRSAVEEGATHVLVLCSRPEDYQPQTRQGIYERLVAPLYFERHGEPAAAKFFAAGGQQYLYAEDILTLEEGKMAGISKAKPGDGVLVPPPRALYGAGDDTESTQKAKGRRQDWKRAHLLPLKVPAGTPELSTLDQDQQNVLEAVRGGFAAAYDILAPAVHRQKGLAGRTVAERLFPRNAEVSSPEKQTDVFRRKQSSSSFAH